ncbi:MAG TPA: MFS transporter [Roseiflexaceae bacterium]|nr:MFS transporter [Roseiflexaceae bacterium]
MSATDRVSRLAAWRSNWFVSPVNQQQRNMRSVLIDGVGVGLVSGAASFLGVFLVRLGASSFLVGLLTSLPALTGMLLAIPVGRYLERQRNMVPWYSRARVLMQGSYALIGLIPFLIHEGSAASIAIVVVWAFATLPQTIVNITFTVVMGSVAGPRQRQYLMSRRWSVLGVTTAITVAIVGWLLERLAFPLNYQMIFIGSFIGGMLSFAFSRQIDIPDREPAPPAAVAQRIPIGQRIAALRTAMHANAAFSRFVLSAFVFNCGLTLAIPLFPLYWVRGLGASDFWIGLINTVNSGIVMIGYFLWSTVVRRRGNGFVLRACAFGLVLYPLLTGLTTIVPPLVLYAALAGIFGAGLNLVLFDISLATCPPERTASYIAVYQFTTYVATLIAPLLAPLLAETLGFSIALYIAAALRLMGAILFFTLGVGMDSAPRSAPAR